MAQNVETQTTSAMELIEDFGNTSEETRSAAITAVATIAMAMAIDNLATAVKDAVKDAKTVALPYRSPKTEE